MKTEQELRILFSKYANNYIEISYDEVEKTLDEDSFIELMKELNLCNKHNVIKRDFISFNWWQLTILLIVYSIFLAIVEGIYEGMF